MAKSKKTTQAKATYEFFKIVPKSKTFLKYNVAPIRLRVVKGEGVNYKPDINVKVNDLNKGKKHFLNLSGDGDEFTIRVLIHKDDEFNGVLKASSFFKVISSLAKNKKTSAAHFKKIKVRAALDYWIRNNVVLMVTTHALDIKNGEYIISANSSRKQVSKDYTTWDLTFTRYTGTVVYAMNFTNAKAKKAIKTYQASQTKKKSKAKAASKPFKNCTYKGMVYSKTKKVTECNKLLQKFLKKYGFYKQSVDGWYGKYTLASVKAFQTKFQKKYGLKPNGKIDARTFNAMTTIDIRQESSVLSLVQQVGKSSTKKKK